MKTFVILLLALALSPLTARADENRLAAQAPVTLRLTLTPGEKLRIIVKNIETDFQEPAPGEEQSADPLDFYKPKKQNETHGETGYDWTVSGRDADGNYIVAVSYAYIRIEQTAGKMVQPDFESLSGFKVVDPGSTVIIDTRQSPMASNPAFTVLKTMPADRIPKAAAKTLALLEFCHDMLNRVLIGRPFRVVVSPLGRVVAVNGMDEIMDRYRDEMGKIKTDLVDRAHLDDLIESFFGEDNVAMTMTMGRMLPLPAHAVMPGDTWSDDYRLELSGFKVPIKRTMRLRDYPGADGSVRVSGRMEMDFPKEKNHVLFETSPHYADINAVVDSGTGMFRSIEISGGVDIIMFERKGDESRRPMGHMKATFGESSKATPISRPDPANAASTQYLGPEGTFRVSLDSTWKQIETDNKFYRDIVNTYKQAGTAAELMIAVAPSSVEKEVNEPLENAAENMKSDMEKSEKKTSVAWNRLFETPQVHWVRYRMDMTEPDGRVKHSWIQVGYGSERDYSILLTSYGELAKDTDAAMTAILDGIAVNDVPPADPFGD